MRALVTGGAGFIGSHLVDALVARGDQCTVIDDLSRGDLANLAGHGDRVRVIRGSVTDADLMRDALAGQEVIFHLASVVGVASTIADPTRVIDVAVNGTLNVLRAADAGAAIVVASSSEVYGRSLDCPFDEVTPSLIGAPSAPRWSYAHAKACSEHLALDAAGSRDLAPTVVRYFNVYGPRMARQDPSVLSRFLDAARAGDDLEVHGDGAQTRSFVYVQDAVDGTLAAGVRGRGQVVNLGGPAEISIADLAALVLRVTGTTARVQYRRKP